MNKYYQNFTEGTIEVQAEVLYIAFDILRWSSSEKRGPFYSVSAGIFYSAINLMT